MAALSIHIPDELANESQAMAQTLGISRTQFIRQAITHELKKYHRQQEQQMLAKAFAAMRQNTAYQDSSFEIEMNLNFHLPDEEDAWWTKE